MAGLLAWAADVVGAGGQSDGEGEKNGFPLVIFTPEQANYALELEQKAASLRRSVQDLRLRIPPAHISQRLPHLHADSIASNAALALQLNAHSATRELAQQREEALLEENAAYEKAIENCQKKIKEKSQEADMLQAKLKEMDITEMRLQSELEESTALSEHIQSEESLDSKTTDNEHNVESSHLSQELDIKKKELIAIEEKVQNLEIRWEQVQKNSLTKPSPGQREKFLDKQLESLIEQLSAKQTQAAALIGEIHEKELELGKMNAQRGRLEKGNMEGSRTRNRFAKGGSLVTSASTDYIVEPLNRSSHADGQVGNHQKVVMRFAVVLYIFLLHLLVYIKISF